MPDAPDDFPMAPVNYENWGKLMKTWATGEDYLKNGHTYRVPTGLDDLKQQLATAQTGMVVPDRIQHLDVVIGRSDTLVLRVPPADLLKAAEQRLKTEDYGLPPFYNDHYDGQSPSALRDEAARLRFHAQRIGDYTISNCQ